MSRNTRNEYRPDTITPPGFHIQEKLEELGMTQSDLAGRIGRAKKTLNEIISGKAPIEPETALQLERVLGIPARFWNNAERHYRDHLARQEERALLEKHLARLEHFPIKEMCKLGWLPKRADAVEMLSEVLNYFGAGSIEALDQVGLQTSAAFRQSAVRRVDTHAVLAWLRKGELEARGIVCRPFQKDRFLGALANIRELTIRPTEEAIPECVRMCAESGVALVFVPELPKTRTWGATRWLTAEKALIQLSARGKTDDQLWFTFFHEAAHILLHAKKDIFLELEGTEDSREDEANRFAANRLIAPDTWMLARQMKLRSKTEVQLFARRCGVAPGIIVGRMQREKIIPWSYLNGLKARIKFRQP
jgi:addiction module HigA family antidote